MLTLSATAPNPLQAARGRVGKSMMNDTTTLDFEFEAHTNPVSDADRDALLANPGFGKVFTDHMVVIKYSVEKGWHDAKVQPRGPIQVDPAMAVLHYAQEIFEGLKAYRTPDGS